jgi:hypothetical protein
MEFNMEMEKNENLIENTLHEDFFFIFVYINLF